MVSQSSAARARARRFALQALYQVQLSDASISEVEAQFRQDYDMKRVDVDYFHELLSGIGREKESLRAIFAPHLDRPVAELDAVVTSALLIGTFELVHRIDIPWRVVINESVELARQFGGEDSHKLVNSVLDRISKEHREVERQSRRP